MATIVEDLKNGCQVTYDRDGYQVTRIMLVHGLTATNKSGRIVEAVDAVMSGLTIGSTAYPDDGEGSPLSGCLLRSVTCRAISGTTATVEMFYSTVLYFQQYGGKTVEEEPFQTDVGTVSFSAGLTQVQTMFGLTGSNTFDVNFPAYVGKGIENADFYGYDESNPRRHSVQFVKDVPQKDIVITTRKTTTRSAIDAEINTYLNKVNSAEWLGGAAGTWKFMGLEGRCDANSAVWDLSWHFSWREAGWTEEGYYIKEDGDAPDAAERARYSSFTSTVTITKYSTANFSSMSLLGTT